MKVFNFKQNQPVVWYNRNSLLSNRFCLYCGANIGPESKILSNKEHLIAREFVPKEYFSSTDFNFIFRACVSCNNQKSNLERHISTTTIFNSESRGGDEKLNELASRKASTDFHPDQKGVLVKDSHMQEDIKFCMGDMNVGIGFVAPPQSNEAYMVELAYRHIQGVFSLYKSSNPLEMNGTRLLPANQFHVLGIYPEKDWGNIQITYFLNRTSGWETICNINTARGFFKVKMLSSKDSNEGIMWVLEWNKSMRLIGAIINTNVNGLELVYPNIPELSWSPWLNLGKSQIRFREEIPLNGEDLLFF